MLQRLQNRRGAARLEDSVAERPGHRLENSGPSEEAKIVRRQVREQLRPQVVGHEPVAPGKRSRALGLGPPRPDRQRGEVQARGPALRMLGELGDLLVRQVHSGCAKELARLRLVHAKVVRPDLQREAPRPQRFRRERGPASRREGHLRALGHVSREYRDGVEACRVIEQVQVIQDQDDRLVHRRQGRSQARDDRRLDGNAG